MKPSPADPLAATKRRQAVQIGLFLLAVTAGTVGAYRYLAAPRATQRAGEVALQRGDAVAARDRLEQAWQRGNRTPETREALARARRTSGDLAGALALYSEALLEQPTDPVLINTVATLFQQTNNLSGGVEFFGRFGGPEKLSPIAQVRLGDLHLQAGKVADALPLYERAAQSVPDDPQIFLRLGTALAWKGQLEQATTALRTALDLEPTLRAAQLQFAQVLFWQGKFADAATEYRRALPQ